MPDLRFLLKVSRPRFWFYIFGPYLVGLAAAAASREDLIDWRFALFGLYFLFPANLLIYGVNDVFDYETDKLNDKKKDYEALVAPDRRKELLVFIIAVNLPFTTAATIYYPHAMPSLLAFLFFSIFYSAPPIRAKTKPFLDSAFNVLYVFPGAFAYQMLSGSFPPVGLMIAAGCWTAAMHAYSAIPDIDADKAAGIKTIASVLGPYGTLAACVILYAASAILSFEYLGIASIALGGAYILLMLASVVSYRSGRLFKLYRAFPLINIGAGFVMFWNVALAKLLPL